VSTHKQVDGSDLKVEESGLIDPQKPEPVLKAYNLREYLDAPIPPREYFLHPIIMRSSMSMIYAPRGLGKTYLALHIAYAIATGGKLFDWVAEVPKRVLYLDGEMPAILLQERIAELVNTDPRDVDHLSDNFLLVPQEFQEHGMPDLASIEGQALFNELVADVDLIIVDNISTLCRASAENKADDWNIVAEWALEMRRLQKSVLFVHHAGKNGQQRGTSKREDLLDVVLGLKETKDETAKGAVFEVHFTKERYLVDDEAKPFVASLANGEWRHVALEDDIKDRVLNLKADGLNQTDIAEELGVHKSTVSRALKRSKSGNGYQEKKKC